MKNVLIAVDYAEASQRVVAEGYAFAKALQANVTLLHVITDSNYYTLPVMGSEGYYYDYYDMSDTREKLIASSNKFLNKIKNLMHDENIKILVEEGDTADTIIDISKKINADVIILGSHSRSWLDNIIMGSVTNKVIKHSKIPLYIIPIKK